MITNKGSFKPIWKDEDVCLMETNNYKSYSAIKISNLSYICIQFPSETDVSFVKEKARRTLSNKIK